jgi:hypothetical protein
MLRMAKNNNFKSEFGRFALNTKAKPESFEKWMTTLYGLAPKNTKKRKRK